MGEMADYYMEQYFDREICFSRKKNRKVVKLPKFIWITSSNDRVDMRDLPLEHLQNAYNYCLRIDNTQKAKEFKEVLDNPNLQNFYK